jgi:hypothetical protein
VGTSTAVPDTPASSPISAIFLDARDDVEKYLGDIGRLFLDDCDPQPENQKSVEQSTDLPRNLDTNTNETASIRLLLEQAALNEEQGDASPLNRWLGDKNENWTPFNLYTHKPPRKAELLFYQSLPEEFSPLRLIKWEKFDGDVEFTTKWEEHRRSTNTHADSNSGLVDHNDGPPSTAPATCGEIETDCNIEGSASRVPRTGIDALRRVRDGDDGSVRVGKRQHKSNLESNLFMACWQFRHSPCLNFGCLTKRWRYTSKAL